MNAAEKRDVAISAARSYLRQQNIKPQSATSQMALAALDDILRSEPTTVAARWYENASDGQIRIFRKEWEQYARKFT